MIRMHLPKILFHADSKYKITSFFFQTVDEDLDKIGVSFVYVDDDSFSAKMKVVDFPALIFFRNNVPLYFEGNVWNEMAVLKVPSNTSKQPLSYSISKNSIHPNISH